MQKKFWLWTLAGLAVVVAVAAWLAKRPNEEKPGSQTIRIGVALSLTGDVAAYGERSRKGIQLAVDEINSSGGIKGSPIELVLEDTNSSSKGGVSVIRKLIDVDHVSIVVGDVLSSSTIAMAPIAERNKVVLFAPGASNPALRDAGDYIFRNWASDDFDGKAMAAYAYENEKNTSAAVLAQRTDYCLGLADAFAKEFSRLGGTVLSKELFDTEIVDFRSILTKLRNAKAKTVYVSAESRQNGTIFRQGSELDYSPQWLGNLSVDTPECAAIAGKARNGVIFSTPAFDVTSDKPEIRRFVSAFRSKYGEDPEAAAGHAYDAIMILAKVIKNVGPNADAVKDALYKVKDFPGVTGTTTFDQYGDVVKDVYIKRITNGTPELLDEFNFAERAGGTR